MYSGYKLRYSLVPINPAQNLPTIVLEEHFACPWCCYFCGGCCAASRSVLYQGMHNQRQPSSGPSRTRNSSQNRIESRKAETLYKNQSTHESSGVMFEDSSFGFHPGQAWIGAYDNTDDGKVWRTPSKNSFKLMVDRN